MSGSDPTSRSRRLIDEAPDRARALARNHRPTVPLDPDDRGFFRVPGSAWIGGRLVEGMLRLDDRPNMQGDSVTIARLAQDVLDSLLQILETGFTGTILWDHGVLYIDARQCLQCRCEVGEAVYSLEMVHVPYEANYAHGEIQWRKDGRPTSKCKSTQAKWTVRARFKQLLADQVAQEPLARPEC